MVLYKNWIDFVIHTGDAEKIRTLEQRLDVTNAINFDIINLKDPEAVAEAASLARERGAISSRSHIIPEGDEFEAMEIDNYGNVTIWTKKYVFKLHRLNGYNCRYEKILGSLRHPPKE